MALFGERLRLLRETHNYTQAELAEKVSATQSQVWRWETGKTEPATDAVIRIANFFNVPTDYLLGLTDSLISVVSVVNPELSHEEIKLLNAYRENDIRRAITIILAKDTKD